MIIMIRLTLQITDQLRKIRMSDVRHDHTDRVRRLFGKRTRYFVRAVIELLHRLIYFFSRFFADISTVIQHTGNSAYGKPCLLCHIL